MKAKIANSKGDCMILSFLAIGVNNVPMAVVSYSDGELDVLPLHELRIDTVKAARSKQVREE